MSQHVAIAGATGAVGTEFLKLLEARDFPMKSLRLLASSRSAGSKLKFRGENLEVEELTPKSFKGIDIAFFSAGGSRSKEFAPHAVDSGAVVIDNSSAFRMDEKVPLVVPEINPKQAFEHQGLIANPNCSTIQMVVARTRSIVQPTSSVLWFPPIRPFPAQAPVRWRNSNNN